MAKTFIGTGRRKRSVARVRMTSGKGKITINGKELPIDKENLNYDLVVASSIEKVVIKAVAEDKKAIINLEEEYELAVGTNEIEIVVTAENGNERTYLLNISKESSDSVESVDDLFLTSNDNKDKKLSILTIIIPIISLIMLLLIVKFKRKDNKKWKKYCME